MGMDISGKNPTTDAGKYFRNSVWCWRPLAGYITETAPVNITDACAYWQSNDGAGLDVDGSAALAAFLRLEIASGRTAQFADAWEKRRLSLPRVTCRLCHGSGIRRDAVGVQEGMPERVVDTPGHPREGQTGWCNGCDGLGTQEPHAFHYPFSVENVVDFCTFLEGCGGFEIW